MLYFYNDFCTQGVEVFTNTDKLRLEDVFLPLNRIALTLDKFLYNEGTKISRSTMCERIFSTKYLDNGSSLSDIIRDDKGYIYSLSKNVTLRTYDITDHSNIVTCGEFIRSFNPNLVISFFHKNVEINTIIFLADILAMSYISEYGIDLKINLDNNVFIDSNDVNSHIFLCQYLSRLFGIIKLLPEDDFNDDSKREALLSYCTTGISRNVEIYKRYLNEIYNSIIPNNDGSITVNGQEKIITKYLLEF